MVEPASSKLSNSVGFTVRTVIVEQVATDPATGLTTAVCTDRTGSEIRVPAYTMRAKGQPPQPGEMWLADQQLGFWTLAAYIGQPGAPDLLPPLSRPVIPELHAGAVTLAAGSGTVAAAWVTVQSVIQLTCQAAGGTPGLLSVGSRTAGTGFTVHSASSSDTSLVGWMLTEPG